MLCTSSSFSLVISVSNTISNEAQIVTRLLGTYLKLQSQHFVCNAIEMCYPITIDQYALNATKKHLGKCLWVISAQLKKMANFCAIFTVILITQCATGNFLLI